MGVIIQSGNGYMRPPKGDNYKRRGWEYVHKLLGYFLFIASIWEVQEGIKLYEIRSGGKDYQLFFWGWIIALGMINAIMLFYIYIYLGVICKQQAPTEKCKQHLGQTARSVSDVDNADSNSS